MPSASDADRALAALDILHDEIDREVDLLANKHSERLQCRRGCSACCVDDLTVERVEAERIRRAYPDLLRDGEPHPAGACAFLNEDGSCRVYADRPSVCRSQGLPLRMFFENEADEVEEHRDICPLNLAGGPPLAALTEDDCWLVGPVELRLGAIADAFSDATADSAAGETPSEVGGRVALRKLFDRSQPAPAEPDPRKSSRPNRAR